MRPELYQDNNTTVQFCLKKPHEIIQFFDIFARQFELWQLNYIHLTSKQIK